MSDVTKANDAVVADGKAFIDAYLRAEVELGKLAGVVGVGYGHKMVAGKFTEDICIHVFVREKKPEDQIAPEQLVPKSFEGYRTDVRVVPRISPSACTNVNAYATVRGGMQIVAAPTGKIGTLMGTLGLVVRKRGSESRDNWYILSNEHVIYANGATKDDHVYQPWPPVLGLKTKQIAVIGDPNYFSLKGARDAKVPNGPYPANPDADPPVRIQERKFYVDCAVARLEVDSACCDSICAYNRIPFDTTIIDWKEDSSPVGAPPQAADDNTARVAGVRSIALDPGILSPTPVVPTDKLVYKVGAKTGRTIGVVRSLFTPANAPIFGTYAMEIEFVPTPSHEHNDCGNDLFSEDGDSGALIVDSQDNAIGLLFGKSDDHPNFTYASHIIPVLEALDICIPTVRPLRKAYSYGCADAEDGSGTKPHDKYSSVQLDPATEVFSGVTLQSQPPVVVARDRRLDTLREQFSATTNGRELLEHFPATSREIGYLVRNSRPVKVAWHRLQGPAFLASFLSHLHGSTPNMPTEIRGIRRETMLTRMHAVLVQEGTPFLHESLARHIDVLLALAGTETLDECLQVLRRLDQTRGSARRAEATA